MTDEAADPVNPAYYKGDRVMQIIFGLTFCIGTVVKYCLRAGNKNTEGRRAADAYRIDLEKARWYLDREISRLKEQK